MRLISLLFLMSTATVLNAKPQVFFNYKIYYTPDHQPYISTLLQFSSGTFKYKGEPGGLVANVEITQIFRHRDSVVFFDKYLLNSPLMIDSVVSDFYDAQRYGIGPGIYNYELIIKDVISGDIVSGEQAIRIDEFTPDKIKLSDIEFIEDAYKTDQQSNFVKNGFFTLPYLTNYYPPEINKIAFYFEIYNANQVLKEGEEYLVTYSITDYKTGIPFESIFKFQRTKAQAITPIIAYLPIETLPSGEFDLKINLINSTNDTIETKSCYFQRRNNISASENLSLENITIDNSFQTLVPRDSIPYFLASIMPISPGFDYETIRMMLKGNDTTMMAKYFYSFWVTTSPGKPYEGWVKYKAQVYY